MPEVDVVVPGDAKGLYASGILHEASIIAAYDQVNAMLLNEFSKSIKQCSSRDRRIARLEKQLETVTATLQKVSAQLELNKPAPQTALNGR